MNSSELEYVPTERGNPALVVDGFPFTFYKQLANGGRSYRCAQYQAKHVMCKSSCTVSIDRSTNKEYISRMPNAHQGHEPLTTAQRDFKRSLGIVKKKCAEPAYASKIKPQRIFNLVMEQCMKDNKLALTSEVAKFMPKYQNVKKTLLKKIIKPTQPAPKTTKDIQLTDEYKFTSDERRFLLFDTEDDDRIICHSSDYQLECLSLATTWHVDGTFNHSADNYYQLYVISAWWLDEMYPCVFFQLKNKSERVYKKMLEHLVNNVSVALSPKIIHGDFEKAAQNAFETQFNVTIKGCYFHFSQAIFRNIKDKGLADLYMHNAHVNHWLQMFKSLALLPLELVKHGYQYLLNTNPDPNNQNITSFLQYFYKTWFVDFPPEIWNHHDTDTPKTNNHNEGFNRSLDFSVEETKPVIYQLISCLKTIELQISTQFLNRTYNAGKKKRQRKRADKDRDTRIGQLKFRLHNNHCDMATFMSSVAYLYPYEIKASNNQSTETTAKTPKPVIHPSIDGVSRANKDKITEYFNEHRSTIIEMVKFIRSRPSNYYNNQQIDTNCNFISNYTQYAYPIQTTGDGNCLYNAISIALFGDESQVLNIKLCAAFMVFEHQEFFQNVFKSDGNDITIAYMIRKIARDREWGNRNSIIALNILTQRPIISYGTSIHNSIITNVTKQQDNPICIAFNVNHFVAILGMTYSQYSVPTLDATHFWRFSYGVFNDY